jgi:hypothetical protein
LEAEGGDDGRLDLLEGDGVCHIESVFRLVGLLTKGYIIFNF